MGLYDDILIEQPKVEEKKNKEVGLYDDILKPQNSIDDDFDIDFNDSQKQSFAEAHPFVSSVPEAGKQFLQGVVHSYPEFGKGVNDAVALLGDKTGLNALSNFGRSNAEFWGNLAEKTQRPQQYQGLEGLAGDNWKSTLLPTITGSIGDQATNILTAAGGGAGGAKLAGQIGTKGLAKAGLITAGTSVPNLAQEGGYLEKIEQFKAINGRNPNTNELKQIQNVALGEKAINTALETVADRLLFGKIFPEGAITKNIKGIAKNVGQQGLTEAGTEAMQEGVSIGAEKLLGLNNDDLAANLRRVGESAAIGGIVGGTVAGGGSMIAQPYETQFVENPDNAIKNVSAQVFNNGKELYNSEPTAFDLMRNLSEQGAYSSKIEEIAPNIAANLQVKNTENLQANETEGQKGNTKVKKKASAKLEAIEKINNYEKLAPNIVAKKQAKDEVKAAEKEQKELVKKAYNILAQASGKNVAYVRMTLNSNGKSAAAKKRAENLIEALKQSADTIDDLSIAGYEGYFGTTEEGNAGIVDRALQIIRGEYKTPEKEINNRYNEEYGEFLKQGYEIKENILNGIKTSESVDDATTHFEKINKLEEKYSKALEQEDFDEIANVYNDKLTELSYNIEKGDINGSSDGINEGNNGGSEAQKTGYDTRGTESTNDRISGNSIQQNGGSSQTQSSQVAIEGLEKESAKSVQKQQDEVTAKENKEKYSTTQGGKQNQMFNTEQFKNGQQMLFDTSDMPKEPEVKKSEPKKKEVKKKETNKLEDSGEFLKGNRKQDTSLTWDDLKEMNDLVRAKNTTKARVYPKPSIEDLKAEGFSEFQAGIIQNVYNKINAKPAAGYDKIEHQQQYVDTINEVMSKVKDYIKSHPDEFTTDLIAEAAKKYRSWSYDYNKSLFDAVFPDTENKKAANRYSSIFRLYPEYNRKALIIGGNKFTGALQLDNKTLIDIKKAIENSKKVTEKGEKVKTEPWEKTFIILEPDKWNKEYAVANKKSKQVLARYETKEEAIAAAKYVHGKIEQMNSQKANFVRNHIERRENNKDVTTEELQNAFGFRGVNFGNWATAKERQNFTNFAYDSLYDLAELLNLPPKAISLNGQLGFAYGAQGKGGFGRVGAAHYIPEYKEINLTKEHGAGSLAHEWWHALDNYFGNQATKKEYSREWALSLTKGGELRPELYEVLENLQKQIKQSPFTEEDIKKRAEQLTIQTKARIKRYADSLKQDYAKSQNSAELHKIIDDLVENQEKYKTYSWEDLHEISNKFFKLVPSNRDTLTNRGKFGWLTGEITRLNDIEELARKGAKKSEYLENAEKIDGQGSGKYWSEDTELGARAFAAYIFDKMANQNIENRFLTRSGDGAVLNLNFFKELAEGEERESLTLSTTPKGEERARIFKAFDKLFDTIKTRETEKGVELYDIEVPNWMNNYEYSTQGYKDIDLETLNNLITRGCTQDELQSVLPSDLQSAFRNIEGYKFYNLKKDARGIHLGKNVKSIGINLSMVGNNPRKFVNTLIHELEHADQEVYYNFLKGKDDLTSDEIAYIEAYERNEELNHEILEYLKNNKRKIDNVVNPFIKKYINLSEEEFYKEVNNIKNKLKRDIIIKHIEYMGKYFNMFREIEAFKSGINYSEVYIDEEREIQQGINGRNKSVKNSSTDRNLGATIRSRFRGHNGNYALGESGGGEKAGKEINKNTSDEINKVVRDKVYNWHGNLESDRYDVDKALNSFINLTKQKAKDFSNRLGFKVTDKQIREIMPFLRERTELPINLNRPELTKLYNALSDTEKTALTKLADSVSNKFEKYYDNYKDVKGEQTAESIENHISHIWDLDDKKKSLLTNYITTNSRFAKKRTIGTLAEGIDGIEINGVNVQFKPKTLDYAEILKSSSDNLIKATHDSILANEIKNLKYQGKPLVLPATKAPDEWIEVNHPALNKAIYMGSVGEKELPLLMKTPVKVHPEIADYVSSIFEVQKNSKFWDMYDSLNGMVKQVLLGFSGFHGYALSESSVGNTGAMKTLKELNPKKFVDAIKNGNYDVYKNEEVAKRAIQAGVQLGTPSDLQRNLVEDALKKIPLVGKYITGAVSANNKILWDVLHNNFKVLAFNTAIENLGGNVSKEQERAVAQWVNDSFGGQAWELLGIKKSSIKAASRILLSPDWNFSTIRQAAAAINSEWLDSKLSDSKLGKRLGKLLGTSEEKSANGARGQIGRGFWIRSAIFFTVFYNVLNAAFREWDRDKHPELYPKEMTPADYSIWSNSYPMDNIYDRIMPKVFIGRNSDGTARMLRVGKQFREVPEFLTEPVTKFGGKTSPIINIVSQVGFGMSPSDIVKRATGKDAYLNQDIWDGYGENATMRTGKEAITGRAKALVKSLVPYIGSKYIGGKHEFSAWDFVAQTSAGASKSKVYKQAKAAFEEGEPDKIREIKLHAYKDGLKKADINKMVGYAEKNYKTENTKKYKKQFVSAIEKKDKKEIYKIKTDMEKHKLSTAEQKRIYTKAWEDYRKNN